MLESMQYNSEDVLQNRGCDVQSRREELVITLHVVYFFVPVRKCSLVFLSAVTPVVRVSKEDDKRDDDNDGIPDVKQASLPF